MGSLCEELGITSTRREGTGGIEWVYSLATAAAAIAPVTQRRQRECISGRDRGVRAPAAANDVLHVGDGYSIRAGGAFRGISMTHPSSNAERERKKGAGFMPRSLR